MKLVLIRHGATPWSVSGRHTGLTDIDLTGDGIAQAQRAAHTLERLVGHDAKAATVFTSPLRRARRTAAIVFGEDRATTVDADLSEFDYGDYEGLTRDQIHDIDPTWDIWTHGCPGGESMIDVSARCDRFLRRADDVGGTVVAVAHGHLLRILAARAVGLDAECGALLLLDTATISVLDDVRSRRVIRLWNVDPATVLSGG